MRVKELIAELQRFESANPEVVVTWEGTRNTIDERDVYLSADGELVIDAGDPQYKERIVSTPGYLFL